MHGVNLSEVTLEDAPGTGDGAKGLGSSRGGNDFLHGLVHLGLADLVDLALEGGNLGRGRGGGLLEGVGGGRGGRNKRVGRGGRALRVNTTFVHMVAVRGQRCVCCMVVGVETGEGGRLRNIQNKRQRRGGDFES